MSIAQLPMRDQVEPIAERNAQGKRLSGISRGPNGQALDPVYRVPVELAPPSQGGPLLIGGHTPGCHNVYDGVPVSDCECEGREAEG